MAGTAVEVRRTALKDSDAYQLPIAHNAVVVDLEALRAALATRLYALHGNPGFVIDTNFDVKNATAVYYTNGGTMKTLSANTSFDTGTAATIATVKWAAALLSVSAAGAGVVTWFTNTGAGYASEALAIAAMTAAAATETPMGYITVLAAGSTWTAGTDALAGGTGGTPATTTNYYNSINPNGLYFGSVDAAADMTAFKLNNNGAAITT